MAKKKGGKLSSDATDSADSTSGNADRDIDQSPDVQAAEEAVFRAEVELKKAKELCDQVRQQATDELKRVREMTVDELVDGTLKLVREYPGPSVVIAAILGFFVGRLFRR